jgi:hypothetical protein
MYHPVACIAREASVTREARTILLTDTNARLTMRLYDNKPAERDMEDANG